MQVIAHCAKCDAGLPVKAAEAPESIKCGGCGHVLPLAFTEALRTDTRVDVCPVCGGPDFYLRKDFNPKVGLTVIIVNVLISAGFYWLGEDLIAYSVLALAALVDLIVYRRLGDVTVCYRCHSEFRGTYQRTAPHFDLHTADVLEQEYGRRTGRR
jgi:hypothetical protein